MPLNSYGVLTARITDTRREDGQDTPHYQVQLTTNDGTHYRAAINVQSAEEPSDLLYFAADNFQHPLTAELPEPGTGWHDLPTRPGGANLDYIRANIVERTQMRPVPTEADGPNNDLADFLDHYIRRAQQDPTAHAYVFGEPWGPEDTPDKIFGFQPGNGVHNVHMNQGNSDKYAQDDGVWQDGGLLLHFAGENRWVAIFLAFQSQSWHTDDETGHALPDQPPQQPGQPQPEPAPAADPLRILAALANPIGGGDEPETITIINTAATPTDLTGWKLADAQKNTMPLPQQDLPAGATLQIPVTADVQLGNDGGALTLLDPRGRKTHGVTYTAEHARAEGTTIVF
ncbi:DUF2278 family protein [Saccharopolyspora griseoalba]|uniref:DUF2278 family protein n=1 Tax=Saccharopolyspora griseoalba TaxID=1431848 RepID=A0ABW2LFJ4_9PSEU